MTNDFNGLGLSRDEALAANVHTSVTGDCPTILSAYGAVLGAGQALNAETALAEALVTLFGHHWFAVETGDVSAMGEVHDALWHLLPRIVTRDEWDTWLAVTGTHEDDPVVRTRGVLADFILSRFDLLFIEEDHADLLRAGYEAVRETSGRY